MTALGDFSALRVPPTVTGGVAFEKCVKNGSGPTNGRILVIGAQMRPHDEAADFSLDPRLLSLDVPVSFLARNTITGGCVPGSLTLYPADMVPDLGSPPPADLIMPHVVADWVVCETPAIAFRAGFGTASIITTLQECRGTLARLALDGSLGTDAPNGWWWLLGLYRGYLGGQSVDAAWDAEHHLHTAPDDLRARVTSVSTLVRANCGIPVQPFPPARSRAIKSMLSHWPPKEFWDRFVESCRMRGAAGKHLADVYAKAAGQIWHDSEVSPAARVV